MLHFIRRAAKSIVAKILLGLLIASFAIWGIGDVFRSHGQGAVASVGDTEVPAERYADALSRIQRALSQQRRQAVTLAEMRQSGIADQVLAGLLRDAAMRDELDRLDIAVPASAVREAITKNPAFQDGQGAFSQFLYQSRLSEAGYSAQSYEAAIRDQLASQLLADAAAPPVVAPPGEAEAIAAYRGESRTLELVRLTPDIAPDPGSPDDATLQAYYEANKQKFLDPERRSGLYLHTDLAELAKQNTPTDDEVRAEYQAHQDRYTREPAREVEQIVFPDMAAAEAAAGRIRSGQASFAEIGAEQDVSVADLSLGRVTRADLPQATADAVFGTDQPGLVGPVQGPFGAVLLNVTKVEPGGVAPLDEVAPKIRDDIAQARARELVNQKANAIDDLRAGGTPLPDIAKQIPGVELVRFSGLDAQGHVAEGAPPPLATDPAFMAEVNAAPEGEERDLVPLSDGSYALVMVQDIVESHVPELSAIRDQVADAWAEQQRVESLETRANELAGRVGQEGLAAVAKEAGLDEPQTVTFTRETIPEELTPKLAEAAFAAAQGDPVVGRRAGGDAVLLGVVKAIDPLAGAELAQQTAAIDKALLEGLQRDQLEYFGRALEARYGASVDQDVVASVFSRMGGSGGR